ncbi:hypothetical protein CA13_38140 [Planctomycetes bacterium CA13]|uniref:Uncharacterized protein n=1 Tax=Novipirellula herctigrandis TaxID=2527986 RepID=A0A5C5Z4T7_9BACT|nr:hypothetical protein CA13_38140 [Planctomycetes bacterium CA13]
MVAIQEKISNVLAQLRSLATIELTPPSQSSAARLASRRLTLEKEKPALKAALTKFDAEDAADLVRLRMDLAACNTTFIEKLVSLIHERINAEREAAAEGSVPLAKRLDRMIV